MTTHTWFYSLLGPLDAPLEKKLQQDFADFLANWKSHGTPVYGSIEIRYKRFVIVQSDPREERPSGCSIDSMRRKVEEILSQYGLKWTDASQVFFRDAGGAIQQVHFRELPGLVSAGVLKAETLVFDHTLSQTDDLGKWEVPLADTWLRRFLPAEKKA